MTILISLGIAILFYGVFSGLIKKHPSIFYIISILIVVGLSFMSREVRKELPRWLNHYVLSPFRRGGFATASFMIVMYLGAIESKSGLVQRFRKIRGEMSIIASISTFGHNLMFGLHFFPKAILHPTEMRTRHLIATYITILLMCMLIPLFITSFKVVRKKMKQKTWAKIQKLAYPFFIGIYVHVMVLFSGRPQKNLLPIIIYSVIYGLYIVLRLTKHFRDKNKSNNRMATT